MKTKITEKYLILRHLGRDVWADETKAFPSYRSLRESPLKADLKIEEDVLSNTEAETLSRDSSVLSLAPAMPMKLLEPVTVKANASPSATNIWGISAVGADQSAFTGKKIVVAVLDTGIDSAHAAFQGINIVEQDFTGEGNGDSVGHGTHCAGTIFGKEVNGTRIGIAPGIGKALIGKVIGRDGGGTDSIIKAIQWALNEGAHIISMSLGIDFPGYVKYLTEGRGIAVEAATSIALEGYRANINIYGSLAEFIRQRGLMFQPTIVVAAAGNESRRPEWEVAVAPPAAASGIISVAALQKAAGGLDVAYFSNTNVDISAPGANILSASPGGGLAEMSGTSMATPHVAGVAALWAEKLLSQNSLTQGSLSAKLVGSARLDPLLPNIDPNDVGGGIVQAPVQ